MALIFKEYVNTPKLTELGTVTSMIPGGTLKFCPGSLAKFNDGLIKAISMVLTAKDGKSTTCPLSKRVSATVQKALEGGAPKRDVISAIAKLKVCESIDGKITTICAPLGKGGEEEEFSIENSAKSAVSYDELVAY